jgi:prevent-host-death family protein
MKSVSVSEAKNRLSALLREVRGGATITITDRGVPVAHLTPPGPSRGIPAHAIELAQRSLLVLPAREPSADWVKGVLPRPKGRGSVVADLIEERRTGR